MGGAGIWMCRGEDMNVMVMDVEGTDGRGRGEDQVRNFSSFSLPLSLLNAFSLGFRTQICIVLVSFVRGSHHQSLGAPGRSLPRCQHGSPQNRLRSQLGSVWEKGSRWVCANRPFFFLFFFL